MYKLKSLLFIILTIALTVIFVGCEELDQKTMSKEETKKENVKQKDVYPVSILDEIKKLETSNESKQMKYQLFDQAVINALPDEIKKDDLEFYKSFVVEDYQKITFEYIKSLNDSELLKMIYRNRPVDLYFVYKEIYDSPLGGVAFNVIQIAREQYQRTLTEDNFNLFKQTMDNHFNNIE
jgi:hypothetical protein